jgi:hypothetical protein
MSLILLIFLTIFNSIPYAHSSACCGSAARFPGTIGNHATYQLNFLLEYNDFIYENISPDGTWYPNTKGLSIETYRFEYSQWLSEQWQYSIAIPFLKRNSFINNSQGWGDIQFTLGFAFEDLPTLIFAQLSLPTGLNRFNAELGPLQSRGRGQWALSLGYQHSHLWKNWDFIHSAQLQFIKSQEFINGRIPTLVESNFAHSLMLGLGYHFNQFRFGLQSLHFYQNPTSVRVNTIYNKGAAESWTSIGLVASWMPTAHQTWMLQLQDQTRIGWPQNTNLGWISSLQFITNW